MRHARLPIRYIFTAAIIAIAGENAMAGWYTDSIKASPVIEVRGELADTARCRELGDRYIDDNLDYLLSANEWLMVNFCAYWCGDCNNFTPDFNRAAGQSDYAGIRWAYADIDGTRGNENLRKRFSLPGTPVVILFHKGEIVKDADGNPAILDGHAGDKTYDDIIAYLNAHYRP